MKKLLAYSFLATLLLFQGCSQKEVEMDDSAAQNKVESSESALDTMSSDKMDEEVTNASDMTEMSANDIKNMFIDTVYFDFDKYELNALNRDVAKKNAQRLSPVASMVKIKLEGNSDEWGTDEYNYALGLKRAKSVKDSLVADGIDADGISLVSFGESNPVCSDKNSNCWKQNRRVEYKILP